MKGEFYKMDFRAWNVGTIDLSLEQEAAYLRLCHAMYDARGPIPNSTRLLMGLFRCGNVKATALVRHLITTGKIELTEDGLLTNRRVSEELVGRDSLSSERSVAGKRGGTASGVARRKANEINGGGQATASSKRTREEERREEKSREEEIEKGPSDITVDEDPFAIFREAASAQAPVIETKPEMTPEVKPESKPVPAKDYAIDQGKVRLTYDDLEKWQKLYPSINVAGEVTGMSGWLNDKAREGKNWFQVAQGALAKRDRERRKEIEDHRIKVEAAAKHGALQAVAPRNMAI
jgi:uncharacterized protein YdaU (DUF1376 family)